MHKTAKNKPQTAGYADEYRVFRMDDSESHWFAGKSPFPALRALAIETCGYKSVSDYLEDTEVMIQIVPWDVRITIHNDPDGNHRVPMTKSAAEWAKTERGMFCSTSY